MMPKQTALPTLVVQRQPAWWIATILTGVAYVLILGRGVEFTHD